MSINRQLSSTFDSKYKDNFPIRVNVQHWNQGTVFT